MNSDLQSLIERASDLQEKVNEEINSPKKKKKKNNTSVGFCNKYCCSEDEEKWLCKFADAPLIFDEETQRLIGLRDSLKQVEDMLIHLQKMRAWHFINRQVAEKQVEESRAILMEKVSDYGGKPHSVINELNSSFGNGRSAFAGWRLNKKKTNCFLLCCMKFLFPLPETWQGVIGGAAKVIAASITVSSTVYFCRRRPQYCRSSIDIRNIPNSHLDVFKGRG
ncbi:uncharacterized protein LOC114750313 [Neltuma alba]|uniref:uncharacterized protein LOC114750313 n=1 Tax=Neltuma alba TaxID=207710 RepID=UPI0010A35314|nr:uncharacterized protein LOC114750313 [Prosopis alba]